MKMTISELAKILEKEFKGKNFTNCDCRSRHPGTGWEIIGCAGYTRAIKAAGLPIADYWSGFLPTPSSQSPKEIVQFCYRVC